MPDRSPDPDEVGDAAPTSGGRRSGLDRLRAARGGAAPAEERAPGAEPTGADAGAGTDRSGSTAVLESRERAGAAKSEPATREDVDAASERDGTEDGGGAGRGRRLRRRGGSGAAAASGAATATPRGRTRGTARPVDPAERPASRG